MYSNCCCRCSFEPEIIKIGQSSHKMYSNNIVNFQESTTILNAHTKKVWKLIVCIYLIYMCKENLTLNNLQWLICHKSQPNQMSVLSVGLRIWWLYPLPWSKNSSSSPKMWCLGHNTKLHLMVRFQFWKSGEFEVLLHYHYSQVYSDWEW